MIVLKHYHSIWKLSGERRTRYINGRVEVDGSGMSKGELAYQMRVEMRSTWSVIASHLEYSSHRVAIKAAKTYAIRHHLPWPVIGYTKGEAIYRCRAIGVSWQLIANRYNQNIDQVRRVAYKYASRNSKPWPPNKRKRYEYQVYQSNSND